MAQGLATTALLSEEQQKLAKAAASVYDLRVDSDAVPWGMNPKIGGHIPYTTIIPY